MRFEHANKERRIGLFADVQISFLSTRSKGNAPSSLTERRMVAQFPSTALIRNIGYELEVSPQLKFCDIFLRLVERGGDRHRKADAAKAHIFP
jgi:hypothetical protein